MQKGFSLVVCCYNSEKKIKPTLEHIIRLRKPKDIAFELIIVDNNSIDKTLEVVTNFAALNRCETKIFSEARIGKPYALEKAFSASRYEYVVICDDDNWLQEDYLEVAIEVLEKKLQVGIIGGQGIINTDGSLPEWFYSLENCYAVGKQYDKSADITDIKGYVWGAGMILRKKVWDEICQKGFKGFLTGRKNESVLMAGEDSELCLLARRVGYKIYFEERLKYFHSISSYRLTWDMLKKLWIGFSRSQVYFDMYEEYFYYRLSGDKTKLKWYYQFKSNASIFFAGCSHINWYKVMFIAFVEDRPGYLPGLYRRKYLYRMKELLHIFFSYNFLMEQIASFKY